MRGNRVLLTCLLVLLSSTYLPAETATGIVFEDRDLDGMHDGGEPGISGVAVSNGRDVVITGSGGSYELPVTEGDILFVTKPSGYAVPLDGDNLPQFYYIHDPDGTDESLGLRYRGVAPTGALPRSIDFPLVRADEPERFDVILFSDPQPQTDVEIGYIRDDVVNSLVGSDAAFGMTLGDIMYDDLALLPRYNRVISTIGIPWYNVAGNHDINYLSRDDEHSLETFKQIFGPPYYSFDFANAHFIVLDVVEYLGTGVGYDKPKPRGQGKYKGHVSERQLDWLAGDLANVPQDRLVILAMHIPLTSFNMAEHASRVVGNLPELFDVLKDRNHLLAIAGHMHTAEHHYFDRDDGFNGPEPLHLHTIAAVAGSWWSGPFDERGIPKAPQADGSPNGYYILSVDGNDAVLKFRAAGRSDKYQMRVMLDSVFQRYQVSALRDKRMAEMLGSPITTDQAAAAEVVVNLFDGGPRSRVILRVDGGDPIEMVRSKRNDPFAEELFKRNPGMIKSWVEAEPSSHIWISRLPAGLSAGAHTLVIEAVDEYGNSHTAHKVIEIVSGN